MPPYVAQRFFAFACDVLARSRQYFPSSRDDDVGAAQLSGFVVIWQRNGSARLHRVSFHFPSVTSHSVHASEPSPKKSFGSPLLHAGKHGTGIAQRANGMMRSVLRSMTFRTALFLSLLAGCGDCGSCGGDGKSKADADPSATEPDPITSPDAIDASLAKRKDAADDDGGAKKATDAGVDANDPRALAPLPEPLARPSGAPMPMGAMQSCGVYDGPLCVKECPKGNCRQECDGVKCELTCKGGWCSQRCGPAGECKMTCAGGHCVQQCQKADGCQRECSGGDCKNQ